MRALYPHRTLFQQHTAQIATALTWETAMKTFEVYERDDYKVQAVKVGFSWPAFFFVGIWAFVKGLVAIGFALLFAASVMGGIFQAAAGSDPGAGLVVFLLTIGFRIFVASRGNDWRRKHLLGNGYRLHSTVAAGSVLEALKAAYPAAANGPAVQPASRNAAVHGSTLQPT